MPNAKARRSDGSGTKVKQHSAYLRRVARQLKLSPFSVGTNDWPDGTLNAQIDLYLAADPPSDLREYLENLRALPGPMQRQFVAYHHMSSRLLKNAAAMAALERVQEAGAGLDRWVEVLSEYYLRIN